jgi:GntR family transcriptional repressor for pyruvate dehydrogenase complex
VEGYVDVRPGSGVFVTMPKNAAPDYSQTEGPLEIMRARKLVEGEIAGEAAAQIRQKDITVLKRILVEMARAAAAPDPTSCILADRNFHVYIAKKIRNNVLLRIATDLLDQRESPLGMQFGVHFDNPKTWTAVIAEHRKIVEALATRDPERARKAMHYHLSKAHDRWVQQLEDGRKARNLRLTRRAGMLH